MGKDRNFTIFYRNGWAMLQATAPSMRSKPLYPDEILNYMKLLGMDPVRSRVIEELLEQSDGSAVRLTPWPDGERLSARVEILIQEGAMEVSIQVHPPKPGGEPVSLKLLQEALKQQGVVYGIEKENLEQIVQKGLYGQSVLAASGTPSVPGQPARIRYHFVTEKKPFRELRYGRMDLKELRFIQNKKKGDVLAELLPSVPPQDGFNVLGERLEAESPGADESLLCGENVELREGKVYALIDGNACLKQGRVSMEALVVLKNVDYSTGHIDFDGSVIVKGAMADGFSLKASGDVEIENCVGRASIEAGRNLLLKSGVNGDSEAVLSCQGDFRARYIEGASLVCHGDVMVQESIMHSNLSVWGNLLLSGGRAELTGGSLLLWGSLWCRKLGGLYETPTSVILGISPDIIQEYSKLLMNQEKKRKQLDEADRLVKSLHSHGKNTAEAEETARKISEELGLLQQKSHKMKRETLPREQSLLVAEDIIYGGVRISFAFIDHSLGSSGGRRMILRCIQGKVIEKGFNPADAGDLLELCMSPVSS